MTKPPRTRLGLRALQQKIEAKGLAALDGRYAGARALQGWRSELIEALGGEEQLSPQQITLIEQVTRLKLFLDHVDSWLMTQPSLINKRKKAILPAMQQRLQLAGELRATLSLIGLKRMPKFVSSIPPGRMKQILAVGREQEEKEKNNGQPERPDSV
jgi:hypothetical protein